MERELTWHEYDLRFFDRLHPKVRAALRQHTHNVDCDKLWKMTPDEALSVLAESRANSSHWVLSDDATR